ncbi:lasso peptide biosynthesis B2 protein [Brevundimonas sp.]|uniref:lasso peptide biosynthesis B2 protein n=1 Tax=Brevundimonas sp. TaxID=1871086 RepID=UPI0019A711A9|nr:lasso peptide biosynthesis B2 protein [Brevundimonas sp.]MBD3836810.1 lasso peptide biosynthesis B2 protein [Brevundimonas sp.]
MDAYLPADVHFAWVGDDIVTLDARNDAYLCLVGAATVVRDRQGGRLEILDPGVFDLLRDAGLAQGEPDPAPRRIALRPQACLSPFEASDGDGLGFVLSGLRSSRRYHGRAFLDLIDEVRGLERPTESAASSTALSQCVAAYRAGLPWIPRQGVCLHRSFMLVCFLAERGVAADWVFGVRTWPFAAHCWAQVGPLVVGDDLHKVARYTPILVV